MRQMSLLDIIGPVMVGPSSSHTAGACRLALLARNLLIEPPRRVRFTLHGSFAKTARGHGTDLALIAGTLGMFPDDIRIRSAFDEARHAGLEYSFDQADLGDVHPNSVRIVVEGGSERISMLGSSLGAGLVKALEINDLSTSFSGSYHTLLVLHTDQPGVIARVATVVADENGNIATLFSTRRKRGGEALMAVEIDRRLSQHALDYLTHLPYTHWVRMLPEVMSGSADENKATAAASAPGLDDGDQG
jgi:L-serine dehydratase